MPELLSIAGYDFRNPKPIESPRSIRAMQLLYIEPNQLVTKSKAFFKDTAISGADLDKLVEKDRRGVKCRVSQVKAKRDEIIKNQNREKEWAAKEQNQQQKKLSKLRNQSVKAEKIIHEIEQKTAEEIEKKIEERYKKMRGGEEITPYYDQYNNLTYVPKPKEYFKLNAKNHSIQYQLDLSKSKVSLLKEKQLREMGHMMDYEINLQQIKKRNEDMHKQKVKTLKSMESLKRNRLAKNMELLHEQERRLKQQKKMEVDVKEENKKRLLMMNERESNIRLQKILENEERAKIMKKSEYDYEQNRRYMVKQLIADFKELKHGKVTTEEIKAQYNYLKDEEAFEKAMHELNRRRHMSKSTIILESEKTKADEANGFRISQYSKKNYSASGHDFRDIQSAVSKPDGSEMASEMNKIDWAEQKKLLRKRQVCTSLP